jgi:hypothetical protein
VNASSFRRKLRGGCQSHLITCDDANSYAVKFQNNPQHRRVLVNELVSAVLLEYLQIATPASALVRVSREFLCANPDVGVTVAGKRLSVEPGFHFGSCYPGEPDRVAVYDFLPDPLLRRVANRHHFLGMLAFDKWVGNADGRQSIFFRTRVVAGQAGGSVPGIVASMIDHGFAFGGPEWMFLRSPVQGLYLRRAVYEDVSGLKAFEPWLALIENFPSEVIDRAWKSVPAEWLIGEDEPRLHDLLERLYRRRCEIPELLQECRSARPTPFPNWY